MTKWALIFLVRFFPQPFSTTSAYSEAINIIENGFLCITANAKILSNVLISILFTAAAADIIVMIVIVIVAVAIRLFLSRWLNENDSPAAIISMY